jgi:hypothetical protein
MSPSKEPFWANPVIYKVIIFGFMILIGLSMAVNIQSKNLLGFSLSLVSLGAGIYVIHLLQKLKESAEQEETN